MGFVHSRTMERNFTTSNHGDGSFGTDHFTVSTSDPDEKLIANEVFGVATEPNPLGSQFNTYGKSQLDDRSIDIFIVSHTLPVGYLFKIPVYRYKEIGVDSSYFETSLYLGHPTEIKVPRNAFVKYCSATIFTGDLGSGAIGQSLIEGIVSCKGTNDDSNGDHISIYDIDWERLRSLF